MAHHDPIDRPAGRPKPTIQYPMAYQRPYQVTHITQAQRRNQYLCLGCHEALIPKMGNINKHHFAHKAGAERCDPDNALHETAKAAITQGVLDAIQYARPYNISIPCQRCRDPITANVATPNAGIATERSLIDSTRADLIITDDHSDTARLIIEVVVHHDVEVHTEHLYRQSGIPVVKVRPSWDNVESLRDSIHTNEFLNAKVSICRPCRDARTAHQNWLQSFESQLHSQIGPKSSSSYHTTQIKQDRFGSFLRYDTRSQVNKHARIIAGLGFVQQRSRPTLFMIKSQGFTIYADLDSTEVMRIWEVDCLPGLYAFPKEPQPPSCRECVLDIVREIFDSNGIPTRRYFMDHGSHNHWTPDDDITAAMPDTTQFRYADF